MFGERGGGLDTTFNEGGLMGAASWRWTSYHTPPSSSMFIFALFFWSPSLSLVRLPLSLAASFFRAPCGCDLSSHVAVLSVGDYFSFLLASVKAEGIEV
mgnify:CR=1 FL=1